MIQSEMMERMPMREYMYEMTRRRLQLQRENPEAMGPKEQTPEQMVAMLDMIGMR